jgi:hypothetical protein
VCLGIQKFRDFIIFRHFTVFSDCKALKGLVENGNSNESVIVRWLMELAHFDFTIEHIYGRKNSFADMLSREFIQGHELNVLEMATSSSNTNNRLCLQVII